MALPVLHPREEESGTLFSSPWAVSPETEKIEASFCERSQAVSPLGYLGRQPTRTLRNPPAQPPPSAPAQRQIRCSIVGTLNGIVGCR
eukprot:scaffold38035_cov74-Cyclotella_meneghiniana.AAC.5